LIGVATVLMGARGSSSREFTAASPPQIQQGLIALDVHKNISFIVRRPPPPRAPSRCGDRARHFRFRRELFDRFTMRSSSEPQLRVDTLESLARSNTAGSSAFRRATPAACRATWWNHTAQE